MQGKEANVGKVYECIGRKANKPFFLEKICCNIYSAEDLVYCVYDNAELLEKDIFTTELANWLEDECEAVSLADRMYKLLSQDAETEQFAAVLLEAFPFISTGQQARFLELLREEDDGDDSLRRKKRGDYFLQKERYVHALNEYERALSEIKEPDLELLGEIYHNMGMARAGLFLLEQARQDFLKAYELDGKAEHYYYYAAAMRFSMSEGEYIRTISEDVQMREITLKLEAKVQEAKANWDSGPGIELAEIMEQNRAGDDSIREEWMDKTIIRLKDDYRRCIQ